MASLKLRSWPFPDDQEVELLWMGSTYMDYKQNWRVRVAFRTPSGEIKILSYPWGTTPLFRIGQIYSNGLLNTIRPLRGAIYQLSIARLDQVNLINGFKLPKRLIDFNKNPELGLQHILQFEQDGIYFCIPVFELIRAMFINSRYLAYYLLQPHGLELLVDRSEFKGSTLYFDISNRVPAKLANDHNARHLSWIYNTPSIRSLWDSVYQLIFNQALRKVPTNPFFILKQGVPISAEIPNIGPIELQVRGEQFINYVLVKEIIAISGFQHPAKEINFWHPSKKRRELVAADKSARLTQTHGDKEYRLNVESENARENNNQDVIEAPPTFMRFTNYPVVATRREDVKVTNAGNGVIFASGRGGQNIGSFDEVSTQDSIVGGDTPPIEFQSLETIPISEAIGLESFFEMIRLVQSNFSFDICMSVVRVPPGKKFSVCPNGSRRSCAIVQISNGIFQKYLVEVARPDDWSISTLVLAPRKSMEARLVESEIKLLLDGLVMKSGHWDQNILDKCTSMLIDKVKHYQSDSLSDWAFRIVNKVS